MLGRRAGVSVRMPSRRALGAYRRAPGALIAVNRVERGRRQRGASATERERGGARRRSGSLRVDCAWCRAPPRLAAGCEHLDHDHAGAATRAWAGRQAWRIRRDIRLLLWVGGRLGGIEECAGRRDVVGAVGVGEEPVVADAVEAPGPPARFAAGTTDTPVEGPDPRVISNTIFADDQDLDDPGGRSAYTYAFGQFIDHDLDLNPNQTPAADGSNTLKIVVPAGDAFFTPGSTINILRGQIDPEKQGQKSGHALA